MAPSSNDWASSYVRRAQERMMAGYARASSKRPCSSSTRSTVIVRRSSSGRSEHTSLDSASGSMGITRSTRYTLVARRRASRSTDEPHGT